MDDLTRAKSLLDAGDAAGAVRALETGLMRPGQHAYALHVAMAKAKQVLGDAAGALAELNKATAMEPGKMPAWAATVEVAHAALAATGGEGTPALPGDDLRRRAAAATVGQHRVAMANGNAERAAAFAVQAAELYEGVGDAQAALAAWRGAVAAETPARASPATLLGLARALDAPRSASSPAQAQDMAEADDARWAALGKLAAEDGFAEEKRAAARLLLARPAHAALMALRVPDLSNDAAPAMDELLRRADALCRLVPGDALALAALALGAELRGDHAQATAWASRVPADSDEPAARARALSVLARGALDQGDYAAAWHCACESERLEQGVFAQSASVRKLNQQRAGAVALTSVASALVNKMEPMDADGHDARVLLSTRTPWLALAKARAAAAGGDGGSLLAGRREAARAAEWGRRAARDAAKLCPGPHWSALEAGFAETLAWVDWVAGLVACSRGADVVVVGDVVGDGEDEQGDDVAHALSVAKSGNARAALEAWARVAPSAPCWARSVARLGRAAALCSLAESGTSAGPDALAELQASAAAEAAERARPHAGARAALGGSAPPTSSQPPPALLLLTCRRLWAERFPPHTPTADPAGDTLVALLEQCVAADAEGLPLAHELLGRFHMGLDRCAAPALGVRALHPRCVPRAQPGKKQVRDAPRAVKSLQRAVDSDALGIGAAAPLAEAMLAAKQEERAAALYARVLEAVGARADSDADRSAASTSGVWALTRVGQMQLQHGKPEAAAVSFARALAWAGARSHKSAGLNLNAAGLAAELLPEGLLGLGEAQARLGRAEAAAESLATALSALVEATAAGEDRRHLRVAACTRLAGVLLSLGEPERAASAVDQGERVLLGECGVGREGPDAATDPAAARLSALASYTGSLAHLDLGRRLRARGETAASLGPLRAAADSAQWAHLAHHHAPSLASAALKLRGDALQELREAHAERGEAEAARACGAEAKRAFASAVWLEPWSALARYDLGRLLVGSASGTGAMEAATAAVMLDPTDSLAWTLLGESLSKEEPVDAEALRRTRALRQHCLVRALELDPESSPGWMALAALYADARRPALELKALSQAQSLDAHSAAAWLSHARLAERQGDWARALDAYDCAVACGGVDAATPDVHLGAARLRARGLEFQMAFGGKISNGGGAVLALQSAAVAAQRLGVGCQADRAEAWELVGLGAEACEGEAAAKSAFGRAAEAWAEAGHAARAAVARARAGEGTASDAEWAEAGAGLDAHGAWAVAAARLRVGGGGVERAAACAEALPTRVERLRALAVVASLAPDAALARKLGNEAAEALLGEDDESLKRAACEALVVLSSAADGAVARVGTESLALAADAARGLRAAAGDDDGADCGLPARADAATLPPWLAVLLHPWSAAVWDSASRAPGLPPTTSAEFARGALRLESGRAGQISLDAVARAVAKAEPHEAAEWVGSPTHYWSGPRLGLKLRHAQPWCV